MAIVLDHHLYGKSAVRLTKLTRHADRHDLKELRVDVRLHGDFATSYTEGDNSKLVATDTMKNIAYAVARQHPLTDIEGYGLALADQFLRHYAHVSAATILLSERGRERLTSGGAPHPHTFVGAGSARRVARIKRTRTAAGVRAGIRRLPLLKTTDSAFSGFIRDRFTTLKDTDDRIFATTLSADWFYASDEVNWGECFDLVRRTLLNVFAVHHSLSAQQTLYAMGEAALGACTDISRIRLAMPNQHRLLVNLAPFGLDNPSEVFVPTAEPFGMISATLRRI